MTPVAIGSRTATAAPGASAPLAISCRGLIKRYPDVVAVNGLDLEVRAGECFGLLGPNGAGKTTTVEILEGLTAPDGGDVQLFGQRWGEGDDRALRARIGIALQETQLGDKLRVHEIVAMFRSFYPRGRDPAEVIERLGLQSKRDAAYVKLSGGQKQRVALACALVGAPDLLFLDEPTTGLDPAARRQIWELIQEFRDGGGTVLLTTHAMDEAAILCDRVGIVDQGRIVDVGSPAALIASLEAEQILRLAWSPAPADDTLPALAALPGVQGAARQGDDVILRVADIGKALTAALAYLAAAGATLLHLSTHEPTLEDVFLARTGRTLREP